MPVEKLLQATRTPENEAEQFREAVETDIGHNIIGANAHRDEAGALQFSFPIVIACEVKPK